jgi:hypothetical protein
MKRYLLWVVVGVSLQAEIVDRIAITVDHQVITELQIDEELRVTAFVNDTSIPMDPASRRSAGERLVAQVLVSREMTLSHYPGPSAADANRYLAQIHGRFSSDAAYEQALRAYRISQAVLVQHFEQQLATLSFVELRFRPNLDIPDSEIENSYDREMATWQAEHPGAPPPSLEASRPSIVNALTEAHTDQILDTWLNEERKRVSISYLDKTLK